jgi:hypothetical protein
MEEHQLNRLLNRLIEGSIKADDFARLQEALRTDPEARQTYYDLLGVDLLLAEQYETPDYITVHSQAMDDSWALRRARRGVIAWSLVGAAAVLLLTLFTFVLLRPAPPDIVINPSADSHFTVNGAVRGGRTMMPGDSLELKHGVVSLALGPFVEACVEGPAVARLIDRQGSIELKRGSAFFQISPGGKGFTVHTPAGIIRDIGTKFGVSVHADGRVETHVTSGAIEIERPGDQGRHRVDAGDAVSWAAGQPFQPASIDADRFIQNLPWESIVFRENFDDPNGTELSGKNPDLGQPWLVLMESNPTLIQRGVLDTSFGPRTLSAGFRSDNSTGRRRVYVTTVTTAVPANISDKAGFVDASESLTLWDKDGRPLFSIVARSSDGHHWQLRDEPGGARSAGTRVSALGAHTLTLCYEHETGLVRLHEGPNPRGPLLDQLKVRSGATPRSLTVSNDGGGDLSIDHLEARVVTYSQDSRTGR